MCNLFKKLRSHYSAILLAIVVGLISLAPQFYFSHYNPGFKGVQMFGTDAEHDYIANINRAYRDDYSKGPFPPDAGKNYYLAPKLGERMVAVLGSMLHVTAIEMNVISKFLFPVILFLILYFWLLEVFSSRAVALLAPLFVMFGMNLLDSAGFVRLISLKSNISGFLPYTRPVNPQVSSIFLFLGLWLTYRLAAGRAGPKGSILLGGIVGLSLFSYIFTWTFMAALLALCFLFFLFRRDALKAKYFLLTATVSILVALPFFMNALRARADVEYLETSARIGLVHSHAPILGMLIVLAYIVLVFFWPKNKSVERSYFLVMVTAVVVVLNQQIVTGIKLQVGHYHWYMTKPILSIVLVFLAVHWITKLGKSRWRAVALLSFAAVLILNGLVVQARSYQANYPVFQEKQKFGPLFTFLNEQFKEPQTIWADPDLSTLIPAYTRHFAPDNFYAPYYIDTRRHLRDMLFLEYRLKGITAQNIMDVMEKDGGYAIGKVTGIYYRELPDAGALNKEREQLAKEYADFSRVSLRENFKNLSIDLVVADKGVNGFNYDTLVFLSKVKEFGDGLSLYQFDSR